MNEATLRELLHDVATEVPMHTAADSYVAASIAQRQRLMRHRLILVGAAALVAIVTLGSVAMAFVTDSSSVPPATPVPVSPTPTVVAPSAFDPAQLQVTPVWLPAGLDHWRVEQEPKGARYTATTGGGFQDSAQRVIVYVAPRNTGVPDLEPENKPMRRTTGPGPTINGSETTWIPRETSKGVRTWAGELRFRWASGAQASVDVRDMANAKELAVRIAESLRVTVDRPTPLPFTSIKPKVPLTRLDIRSGGGTSSIRAMYLARAGVGPGVEFQLNMGGSAQPTTQIGPYAVSKTAVSSGEYHYYFTADTNTKVMAVSRPEPGRTQAGLEFAERAIASFEMTGDIREPSSWK
ncbi:hypothetical protein [Cryptosporangium arvum]|uniref:Uncharacterized protein n=1 Tax=Cryptosporangium arvum DSM 44712 TaxID=927661 RepID=A0A011ABR0_9ACTN|nr:hypothetical protein [Cryptosporangium arvum]EXG79466.1 hypothetical protein CryarDRAFT_0504 [Cryptosporangium arvum DSM 44712]